MSNMQTPPDVADPSTLGCYQSSQTALLLLDFHSLFVEKAGGPGAPTALATAVKLRIWAKSQGIMVIHALLNIDKSPYPTCKGADRLSAVLNAMKSSGGEEPEELLHNYDDGDITFTRSPGHVSALKSPGLQDYLKEKGIKSLILTKVSTSGCGMRTAVPATDDEYVVTIISDGYADADKNLHDVLLQRVLASRAYVTTAAEFQENYISSIDQ
ncbi:unnamed protein product [Aureobasidium vineae]|uniref:Isochorismatase-like domain-containing protein n=1 Tax=Aureobasidium vineae TaxID=2773715 RepID=A0A9N8JEE1_9PEZI|nr:unnamed protein product [Aureobasidium vineae]